MVNYNAYSGSRICRIAEIRWTCTQGSTQFAAGQWDPASNNAAWALRAVTGPTGTKYRARIDTAGTSTAGKASEISSNVTGNSEVVSFDYAYSGGITPYLGGALVGYSNVANLATSNVLVDSSALITIGSGQVSYGDTWQGAIAEVQMHPSRTAEVAALEANAAAFYS